MTIITVATRVSPSGKALASQASIRRFESVHPLTINSPLGLFFIHKFQLSDFLLANSFILGYFEDKSEVIESGAWDDLEMNFMDKYESTNKTAWQLTERGLSFIAATVHK